MNNMVNVRIRHQSIYGLCIYFLLLPFEYPLAQYGVGSILRYVGIFTMGLAIFDLAKLQAFRIQKNYRTVTIVFWMLLVLITAVWAIDITRYKSLSSIYINNALMFLLISMIEYDDYEIVFLKRAYIIGLVLLLAYMTFIPGAVTYSSWQHRLTIAASDGTELLDQNYLAAIMLIPFALVLNVIFDKGTRFIKRCFMIIISFGVIYYIFATGSRSGLIAVCVILALILRRNAMRHAFIVVTTIAILIFFTLIVLNFLSSDILMRYSVGAITGKTDESGERLLIWTSVINSMNPVRIIVGFGAGSGQSVVGLHYYRQPAIHSFYIAHITELGLIGFIPFITAIIRMCKDIWYRMRYDILYGFIGIMVMGLFLDLLTTKFFWCGMMLIAVCASTEGCNEER